jgi:hypothetical protein
MTGRSALIPQIRSTSIASFFSFSFSASAAAACASFFSCVFLRFSSCDTDTWRRQLRIRACEERAHYLLLGLDRELMPLLHGPFTVRLCARGPRTRGKRAVPF